MPIPEAIFIGSLFTLTFLAIGVEVLRQISGQSRISKSQFRFRMFGGGVMLFLMVLITLGALFMRPEDGKVFGWYWTFCAVVLLGLLLILRDDVARTRRDILTEYQRIRDDQLAGLQSIFEKHGRSGTGPQDGAV